MAKKETLRSRICAELPEGMPDGLLSIREHSNGVSMKWDDGHHVATAVVPWIDIENEKAMHGTSIPFLVNVLVTEIWNVMNPEQQLLRPAAATTEQAHGIKAGKATDEKLDRLSAELESTNDPEAHLASARRAITALGPVPAPPSDTGGSLTTAILEARGALRVAPLPPLPAIGPFIEYDLEELTRWGDRYGQAVPIRQIVAALRDQEKWSTARGDLIGVVDGVAEDLEEAQKNIEAALTAINSRDTKLDLIKLKLDLNQLKSQIVSAITDLKDGKKEASK